jgi:Cu-Zn family superoxide dismutase
MSAVAYFPEQNGVAGSVVFDNVVDGCVVRAYFSKLPQGEHGFHIHNAGDLRGEGCKGACDHYHTGPLANHGGPPNSPGPRHTGDLGNISKAPFYQLYHLKNVNVEDLYGRSLIVHADQDDLGKGTFEDSKKTGHSGARIACAIIGRIGKKSSRQTLKNRNK